MFEWKVFCKNLVCDGTITKECVQYTHFFCRRSVTAVWRTTIRVQGCSEFSNWPPILCGLNLKDRLLRSPDAKYIQYPKTGGEKKNVIYIYITWHRINKCIQSGFLQSGRVFSCRQAQRKRVYVGCRNNVWLAINQEKENYEYLWVKCASLLWIETRGEKTHKTKTKCTKQLLNIL